MNKPVSHPTTLNHILVVDDIADNSFLLQTVLESEGYQVEIAENGHVALKKIAAAPPALVLLDVMMPEMNGFEVTRHVRQHPELSDLPILLITGYDQCSPADSSAVGADGLIHKPIDFDELLSQVRTYLRSDI
ncbi:MAG: response regulator [Synechococcales cyanobacterium C42_A2020_086]|jgi:CheY-like chemotaxis protein|nr:response regulator [Synechococcales cyanobacterium M58_A2018_015]MBF2075213.1 response regulator [Synechococcales cyanobacterium C42_A2020_086]